VTEINPNRIQIQNAIRTAGLALRPTFTSSVVSSPSWAHQVLTLSIVILVNRMNYELISLANEKPSSDAGVETL
jgi:hypothetical protein